MEQHQDAGSANEAPRLNIPSKSSSDGIYGYPLHEIDVWSCPVFPEATEKPQGSGSETCGTLDDLIEEMLVTQQSCAENPERHLSRSTTFFEAEELTQEERPEQEHATLSQYLIPAENHLQNAGDYYQPSDPFETSNQQWNDVVDNGIINQQHTWADILNNAQGFEHGALASLNEATGHSICAGQTIDEVISPLQGYLDQHEADSDSSIDLDFPELASPDLTNVPNDTMTGNQQHMAWSTENRRMQNRSLGTDVNHTTRASVRTTAGSSTSTAAGNIHPGVISTMEISGSSYDKDPQMSLQNSKRTCCRDSMRYHANADDPTPPREVARGHRSHIPDLVVYLEQDKSAPPKVRGGRSRHEEPAQDENHLSVPMRQGPLSFTSSTMPEVLHCEICDIDFGGEHRRGSWSRHNRLKHRDQKVQYPCRGDGCKRVFQRSDARLKHYRKHHRHLAPEDAVPRPNTAGRGPVQKGSQRGENAETQPAAFFQNPPSMFRNDSSRHGNSRSRELIAPQRDQELLGIRPLTPQRPGN